LRNSQTDIFTFKILPIEDIYKFEIAKLMYNWNKSKTPISITDYFLKRADIRMTTGYKFPDIDLTDYKSV